MQQPEVERVLRRVGGFGGGGVQHRHPLRDLVPPDERELDAGRVLRRPARKELNSYPRPARRRAGPLAAGLHRAARLPGRVLGARPGLGQAGRAQPTDMTREAAASGLVVDVDTDYQLGMPELRIVPDRARAADLGVSVEDVATTLNALVGGVRVGKYSSGGRRIDVRVRLLAVQRTRPEDLARLRVRTASGELVPLSSLVTNEERPALQAITRRDRERAITIYANVAPGHVAGRGAAVRRAARQGAAAGLPRGARRRQRGLPRVDGRACSSRWSSASSSRTWCSASQFNSFLHPVTVLTDPAAVDRRRRVRAAGRPARRSTSSA